MRSAWCSLGAAIVLLMLGATPPSVKPSGAPAPAGFERVSCHRGALSLLKPVSWHLKQKQAPDGQKACFVSLENIDSEGSFQTGLTILILPNVQNGAHGFGQPMRDLLALETEASGGTVHAVWEENAERGIRAYGISFTKPSTRRPNGSTRAHTLLAVDARHETGYVVLFESPRERWDETWKQGKVIVSEIVFGS